MTKKRLGWSVVALFLCSMMLNSAAPPKKGTPKTAPAKLGDPAMYWWYKNETPYIGKEISKLAVGINEEIPIFIQALDSNGRDTGVCPVEWKADKTILTITPVTGKCNVVKIKGLKASDNAALTVVFKGEKGNKIETSLKGTVGAVPASPDKSPAQASKPAATPAQQKSSAAPSKPAAPTTTNKPK